VSTLSRLSAFAAALTLAVTVSTQTFVAAPHSAAVAVGYGPASPQLDPQHGIPTVRPKTA